MSRYFFHLFDDVVTRDSEGKELPDASDALAVAVLSARDIASTQVRAGRLNLGHRIVVEDECGQIVQTVYFRDVVDIVS